MCIRDRFSHDGFMVHNTFPGDINVDELRVEDVGRILNDSSIGRINKNFLLIGTCSCKLVISSHNPARNQVHIDRAILTIYNQGCSSVLCCGRCCQLIRMFVTRFLRGPPAFLSRGIRRLYFSSACRTNHLGRLPDLRSGLNNDGSAMGHGTIWVTFLAS